MAERELKRLSRRELLEMLIAQGRENERLQAEVTQLQAQLDDREIRLAQSGNIAEAALRLNGVFEAAQRAAEQYLENITRGGSGHIMTGETAEQPAGDPAEESAPPEQSEAVPEPEAAAAEPEQVAAEPEEAEAVPEPEKPAVEPEEAAAKPPKAAKPQKNAKKSKKSKKRRNAKKSKRSKR